MKFWNETPLFRFLILFIAGILIAVYVPGISPEAAAFGCSLLISGLVIKMMLRKRIYSYKRRWIPGAFSYGVSLLSGYALTILNSENIYPHHFRNIERVESYCGILTQPPEEKPKSYKTFLRITAVKNADGWREATGNCLVFFSRDSASGQLKYGDLILFRKRPVEVPPPPNPNQFDYRKWLSCNKVFDQVYLEDSWTMLAGGNGSRLTEFSYRLRDKLLRVFRDHGIRDQEYAVLSALILGYEDDIGQETMSAYAASGALHVLSVSGLHVGIIYIALNLLLNFLNRSRQLKLLKAVIVILFLWFYALLTGLSPSVLRSATMLSFIVIGSMARQHTNLYNTLAASAFFLLGLNPFLIMQVGFQLSYAAVLGIIVLQEPLRQLWSPPGWFGAQLWSLTAVSLAAQLATFPLGLFYFNQFPVYFLIANLLVIPLSTVIIYGGILLMAVSWWTSAANLTGFLLGYTVKWMNQIVSMIESAPFALISGISITHAETVLIYLCTAALLFFLAKQKQVALLAGVFFIALLFLSQIHESWRTAGSRMFAVYSMKGKSALNLMIDRKNYLITDSVTAGDSKTLRFNIYQHWYFHDTNERRVRAIHRDSFDTPVLVYRNFIQAGEMNIFCLKDPKDLRNNLSGSGVDYLVLSGNPDVSVGQLCQSIRFRKLIIDTSNPAGRALKWLQESNRLNVPVHSVHHHGAFVVNFAP